MEEPTKKVKAPFVTINPDAIITLEVGGAFYQRLNKVLNDWAALKEVDQLMLAMRKIKHNKDLDDFAYNLETLMILIHDIDYLFKQQGFTQTEHVEIEVPLDFDESILNTDQPEKDGEH